jgi:hypothetical protein
MADGARAKGAGVGGIGDKSDVPAFLFFGGFWRFSGLILKHILMVFLTSSCHAERSG